MAHYNWIMENFFVIASDYRSKSLLYYAEGDLCCEINGMPMSCKNEDEFWELVDFFDGDDFAV